MGHDVIFFDIRSTKAKQFGFSLDLADGRLTCVVMSRISPGKKPMSGIVNGSFMKLSASMPKRISSIPMRNTIRPSKTPAKRQPAWAYRI